MTAKIKTLLPAGLLSLTLALASCGGTTTDTGSTPTPPATASPSSSTTVTPAAGPHNDADVMFATMMIPHHQQAVQMSEILLVKDGIDPQVRDLASAIKAAQAPEIAQMNGWLAGWGANPSPSGTGGMSHGGDDGMMTQADMDAFQKASGAEAQKMFLTGMIKHHQGAVAMAQTEFQQGRNPEAKKLAQSIIASQETEITQMRELLDS